MRILFVTQKVDADHPVLAQTVDVVRELAARCEAVDVLCDSVGRHDLPANVRLRTFGAGTRVGRGLGSCGRSPGWRSPGRRGRAPS